jgi:nitronate monooxygenase
VSGVLDALVHPVVAAPMAGGPTTPALAAAVSGAGGLGFLAAGYLPPERFAADLAEVRRLTAEPFGVNVFVPGAAVDAAAVRAYADRLAPEAQRWGVPLGAPVGGDDGYAAKVALLLAEPVAVVSFAFGLPSASVVAALRERGSEVWVTVTAPAEADAASALGVDALVVQGVEAGAHRGGAVDTDEYGLLALLRLVAARAPGLPLVATGGIADGAGVAAVLAAGAGAAQLGTAFLACPEAGTSPVHRDALGAEPAAPTALTRAFTGRRARGIVNRFMREYGADAPAAYPHVHQLTAPLRAAARTAGDPDAVNLWAGQAYPLVRALPAADLVRLLVAEAADAVRAAADRLGT